MSAPDVALLWAVCIFSIGFSAVSLIASLWAAAKLLRPPSDSVEALAQRVHAHEATLLDFEDRIAQWMRRDRVRRVRDAQELPTGEPQVLDQVELKRRVKAAALGLPRT